LQEISIFVFNFEICTKFPIFGIFRDTLGYAILQLWLRRNAGGDNARERALDEMMDGVLEVKNEDILKQDIPRPEFMDDPELRESEWNEEQKKVAKDYEKRVKTLEEDRVKHRKALEAEVKKQQQGVQDALASFDVALQELYNKLEFKIFN